MNENQSTTETINQMIGGYWITQAVFVAAELGIADLLIDGPRTVEDLADKSGAHSESLYRLLRALASFGVFFEAEDRRFSLTPLADTLRSDIPGSQRSFARVMGAEMYQGWGHILHSVKTAEPAFNKAHGKPIFQHLGENPERGKIFDEAMTGIHGGETQPMIEAYDFSQFETVVDIGGGNGGVLGEILASHPTLKGILFDMPGVVDRARPDLENSEYSDRLEVVGGDFFSSVASGGDAYVMRHILHDWDDDEAIMILAKCREAMNPGGKILVVETVIPPGNEPNFGKWLDLMMLTIGGRERTKEQYEAIFSAAGLRLNRIVPTSVEVSVIEAVSTD